MTDKEIIQVLRICATHIEKGCGLCPQMKYVRCTERLADEAITMIERLNAENTALREGASLGKAKRPQKKAYEKSIEFLRALTDGQSDEIKRLRRELEGNDMVIALAQRKQAEAEAESQPEEASGTEPDTEGAEAAPAEDPTAAAAEQQ